MVSTDGSRRRDVMMAIRVSEEGRALIARRMEQAGVRLLRRYNANLNQIAKRANETRNIYEADIQDLRGQVDGLWAQVRVALKGLAKL